MDEITVDVAVVGGGACGVMTALRAARNTHLTIGVFEKSTRDGANAAISSGSLAAGSTRFQLEAGIEDSPEQHAREILEASGDDTMAPVVHAVCRAAPEYVEWIAGELDYPVELGLDMPRAGMSVPRLHTDVGRRGGARLMSHLRNALSTRNNVAVVDRAPAMSLSVDNGEVVGAMVEQNGQRAQVRARTVVLALDGFAANSDLFNEHCAELGQPYYGGVSTSEGDAIPWLRDLDVELRNMGSCLRHGLIVVNHGTRVSPALPFYAAVLVDKEGERFVDEQSLGYSALASVLQQQPGERAAMVWDEEAMAATRESELMRDSLASGAFSRHPDVGSLSAATGVPAHVLNRSLQPLTGRRALRAPYYLVWVTHGVLTTQGGAVVDAEGRVLRRDGTPIPGLRAGGGTTAGLSGARSSGYSSGNGLLSAFGMGWIVGNDLAARH